MATIRSSCPVAVSSRETPGSAALLPQPDSGSDTTARPSLDQPSPKEARPSTQSGPIPLTPCGRRWSRPRSRTPSAPRARRTTGPAPAVRRMMAWPMPVPERRVAVPAAGGPDEHGRLAGTVDDVDAPGQGVGSRSTAQGTRSRPRASAEVQPAGASAAPGGSGSTCPGCARRRGPLTARERGRVPRALRRGCKPQGPIQRLDRNAASGRGLQSFSAGAVRRRRRRRAGRDEGRRVLVVQGIPRQDADEDHHGRGHTDEDGPLYGRT